MKTAFAMTILAGAIALAPAAAQEHDAHRILPAESIAWSAAPASLPPGAEAAMLYGDPSQEGLFILRVRMPDGYRIAPHTHPRPEILTVLSGTFHLAMGDEPAVALPAGSFFALEPGMVHHARTEGETVIQISTTGPWTITYVNPQDDPRSR
jgi:quercetin dioxygenase-like cupin family protein